MSPPGMTWELRPDLEILPAEGESGRPAVLVHDPVTGDFDRVDWPESDILGVLRAFRRPATLEEVISKFSSASTVRPGPDDMLGYLVALGRRGWLRDARFWPARHRAKKRPGIAALVARCLFVQIRLVRPENFLRRTAGLLRVVANAPVRALLAACGLAGLYLALPRWEEYWRDSLGGFASGKFPAFILALILVKTIHEFAHAYTATLAGARVTGMGVAFFFFMPLPFTDVTDAWRLPWAKRLRVAVAGMAAEVAVAGVALLLWALAPPGAAAASLARLSSVALLSTLLTNLNPGPRFDGYYTLVCLLRTENLRQRAADELRRILWGGLFGLESPGPEGGMAAGRRVAVLAYAVYAFFYRVSLGCGLILMAYYMLPKAVGIPLAVLEAWLFFGHPVFSELSLLARNVRNMRPTPLFAVFLLSLAGLAVWLAGEWPRRISFPGVTRAAVEEAIRTQRSGEVAEIGAAREARVVAGGRLAILSAPGDAPLLRRAEWALREAETAEEQAWRGDGSRREAGRRGAEADRRRGELEALRSREAYLEIVSPAAGVLAAWDPAVVPGVHLSRGRLLGWVVDAPVDTLSCYAGIEAAGRLEVGSDAVFFPDSGEAAVKGRIVRIDPSRPEILEDPQLAGVLGAVPLRNGGHSLPAPYARVTVKLAGGASRVGQTGRVWVWSRPESLLRRGWLWLKELAVRESAF